MYVIQCIIITGLSNKDPIVIDDEKEYIVIESSSLSSPSKEMNIRPSITTKKKKKSRRERKREKEKNKLKGNSSLGLIPT